jgi:mono/diheme cytochrome c family protein
MRINFSTGLQGSNGAVAATVCLLAILCTPLAPILGQVVRSQPTQNALAGAQVFGSEGCVKCHAIKGLGGTEGPDLARFPRARTFYDLAAAMWNHLPGMVQRMRELGIEQPHLTGRETGDLIAFLYTLDYFDPAGDGGKGEELFAERHCIVCHQVGGVGGVVGPDLASRGQFVAPIQVAAAMWNHGPAMSEAMQARGIGRPRFTGDELADLIAYLESDSLKVVSGPLYVVPGLVGDGRRVFSEKGCIGCHAVQGSGSRFGPDLAERGVHRSLLAFAAAMWNKAPEMIQAMRQRGISVPQLRPEEMADLVGYLYSVKYFAQAGDPERGRRRVWDKGCLDCHSLDGRGGSAAGDIAEARGLSSPAAVIAALWNHTLLKDEVGGSVISWPVFQRAEMADLAAFLQSLERSPAGG